MSKDLYIVITGISETGTAGGASISFNYGSSFDSSTGNITLIGREPSSGTSNFSSSPGISLPSALSDSSSFSTAVSKIHFQVGGITDTTYDSLNVFKKSGATTVGTTSAIAGTSLGDFRSEASGGTCYITFENPKKGDLPLIVKLYYNTTTS